MKTISKDSNVPHKRFKIGVLIFLAIVPFQLNGIYNPILLERSPAAFWIADFFAWVILPFLIYLYGKKTGLFTNQELGFHLDIWGKVKADKFFFGVLILPIILYFAYKYLFQLGAAIFSFDPSFLYKQAIQDTGFYVIIKAFYAAITAGLVEEFIYRGMFKLLFKTDTLGVILYVLLSSLLFSSVHWESGTANIFATFCFGVITAVFYLWLKNLWPLALSHFIIDLIGFSGGSF